MIITLGVHAWLLALAILAIIVFVVFLVLFFVRETLLFGVLLVGFVGLFAFVICLGIYIYQLDQNNPATRGFIQIKKIENNERR